MNRVAALILMLIFAFSSLIVVDSACAQSVPAPSAPVFTATLVDRSYDVPASSSVDPYTGETINHPAQRVENYSIDLVIKNQPFTAFVGDEHGNTVQIQYNVRIKQSSETNNWVEVYSPYNGYPIQANSDAYTTFNISIQGGWDSSLGSIAGTQSDIQVEALAGYVHRMVVWSPSFGAPYVFNGTESGWSKTQTVSIPENIPMTTPSPTPTVPALSWLDILPLLLAVFSVAISVLAVALIVRHRKIANLNK